MSSFRFRLQRVLGVRRIEEELARAEWQDAERIARLAESQARELQDAVARAREQLSRLQSGADLRPAEIVLAQALVDRLREQWVHKTIHASRTRREAESLRLAMAERRSRVRGLETLHDRARATWNREREARENAELDERRRPKLQPLEGDEHRTGPRTRS